MNPINENKSQLILKALEEVLKELEQPTGQITKVKKELRDRLQATLEGTKSEQWAIAVRDRYAPWVPAELDIEGIRDFAERVLNHPSADLEHIFPEDDLAVDLGI